MTENDLKNEESQSFELHDQRDPIPPKDVVAYNEQRSCADLFRMYKNGKLEIQPDFQREVVWKQNERSRFIDSLVKQLPIPSMCFSLDPATQKWKVIDGLQRMSSIIAFLEDKDWQISSLDDIHPTLRGKTNTELRAGTDDQRKLFASVEDVTIPITVIRCNYNDPRHMSYLFTIFNRLNSGGVRLNNQEIRNCIYSGDFNNLLKSLDQNNSYWKEVKKRIWGSMDRFKSVEILLRSLAFSNNLDSYNGNLAGFLNDYMGQTSETSAEFLNSLKEKIEIMTKVASMILRRFVAGKKSVTFIEGLLVGLLANVDVIKSLSEDDLNAYIIAKAEGFQQLPEFVNVQRYAVSNEQIVKGRLRSAITYLSPL